MQLRKVLKEYKLCKYYARFRFSGPISGQLNIICSVRLLIKDNVSAERVLANVNKCNARKNRTGSKTVNKV